MNGNIRLGSLFGIPFFINPSWFLVFGLVTWSYGSQLAAAQVLGPLLPWLLGALTALLLFSSVVAHELGHSLVARQQGVRVNSITLFLFGGLASLDREAKTPEGAFAIAIAGPLVSVVLFGIFQAIDLFVPLPIVWQALVGLLASVNLLLAAFNMIPGLPLDGGNVLKAIVWKLTNNPYRGIRIASRVGQVFGYAAISTGLLAVLGVSPIGSVWTLLIGLFLLQNAGNSAQSAQIQEELSNLTAAEAVTPDSPVVPATLDLRSFANTYVIGKDRWHKFLVVDADGKLLGTLAIDDLKQVATSDWPQTMVTALIQPYDGETIAAEESLLDVVMFFEKTTRSQMPVVRADGRVLGLLEKPAIAQLIADRREGGEATDSPAATAKSLQEAAKPES
ncbi:MAG: site-2 protease family protein [Cyanobacteria bacterium J06641_5]